MKKNQGLIFASSLAVCYLASAIGSVFTMPSITSGWYASLEKPFFVPPDWLFAPVWFVLYTLMGIALYLIIREAHKNHKKNKKTHNAILFFNLQLLLNVLWPYVFFFKQNVFYGFLVIVTLVVAIILTLICFYKINKNAGYLLFAYLLWVLYAMVLNFSIWQINL